MFKSILFITTLVAVSSAFTNQAVSSSLSGNSGYVYGPPQGANFNYDVAKSYGQSNAAVSSWSNNMQYPRINALSDGYAYNSGISTVSAFAAPTAHGYQWNQGYYNTPGYQNSGYYNNGYNSRPYPNSNYVGNRGYSGWNYNRPYYSSIQHHNK